MRNRLQEAAWNGHTEIVRDLIDNRNGNPDDAFHSAVMLDHLDIVSLLIEKGADINNKILGTRYRYAIEGAALWGHHDLVELLVRKGSNFYGALYHAVQNRKVYNKKYDENRMKRSLDTIHVLLNKGADVNAAVGRRSALHEAVMNGFVDGECADSVRGVRAWCSSPKR